MAQWIVIEQRIWTAAKTTEFTDAFWVRQLQMFDHQWNCFWFLSHFIYCHLCFARARSASSVLHRVLHIGSTDIFLKMHSVCTSELVTSAWYVFRFLKTVYPWSPWSHVLYWWLRCDLYQICERAWFDVSGCDFATCRGQSVNIY